MSFNPQTLRTKLATATETADSITSVAQWILFYKRHAEAVAQQWAQALTADENKLAQIYIANEVIQQSKNKKKAEFVAAFADVLPQALAAAYSQADLPTRDRIARVVKVWRERLVFTPEAQREIEGVLNSRGASPPVPADLQLLARKYADLQAAVSRTPAGSVQTLAEEVEAELEALRHKVQELVRSASEPIKSPDIEPLSPAANAAEPEAEPEPETYTAQDAAASAALAQAGEDVGYAESSDESSGEPSGEPSGEAEPPAKKARVDLDPKLSSFLANISKTGM